MSNVSSVLLIDDDPNVRHVLFHMLELLKLQVIEAGNGIAGLSLFRQHRPRVVITDIIMPEMDGIEVLREIRSLDPDAQIIAMSGGGRGKYADPLALARELGAAETLRKPVNILQLHAAVTRILQRDHEAPMPYRHAGAEYATRRDLIVAQIADWVSGNGMKDVVAIFARQSDEQLAQELAAESWYIGAEDERGSGDAKPAEILAALAKLRVEMPGGER